MHRLFSMPLIECIRSARLPSADDLAIVAQQILEEGLAPRCIGDYGEARAMAMAALCGENGSCATV